MIFPLYRGWNFKNAPATSFGGYLTDSPAVLMNSSLISMAKMHKERISSLPSLLEMSSIIFCCHVPRIHQGRRSQKFQSNEIFSIT